MSGDYIIIVIIIKTKMAIDIVICLSVFNGNVTDTGNSIKNDTSTKKQKQNVIRLIYIKRDKQHEPTTIKSKAIILLAKAYEYINDITSFTIQMK